MSPPVRTDPATAHDGFLDHPLVHAYTSMRTLGGLFRHIDSVIAEIRTRTEPGARVFSLALRGAERELEVAQALPDRRFDVVDVSRERVDAALGEVERRGLGNIDVRVDSPDQPALERGAYSIVTGQYSIHFLEDVERFWQACHDALHPGGTILAQEHIGPGRLRWTEAQVEAANHALDDLVPDAHKVHHRAVDTALTDELLRSEPLAAARSDELVTTCEQAGFEVVTNIGGGCALLHPVLVKQIDTYDPANWEHNHVLSRLFAEEARLMDEGVLGHSFAMFIARRG